MSIVSAYKRKIKTIRLTDCLGELFIFLIILLKNIKNLVLLFKNGWLCVIIV